MQLFKKKSFRRKIEVGPQKIKNYIGTNAFYHCEGEKHIGFFFLRPPVFARYPISGNWQTLQNGVKKFTFPNKDSLPYNILNSLFIMPYRK